MKSTKIVSSLKDVDADYLIGSTAKLGTDYNIPRSPLTPQACAEKVVNLKNDVAILIGREGKGLYNEELALCDFIINIPSSKAYPTLNAVSAATILLYELFVAKNKEKIGGLLNPNIERMLRLKPTHLFGVPAHESLNQDLQKFGLGVFMIPNETIADLLLSIR